MQKKVMQRKCLSSFSPAKMRWRVRDLTVSLLDTASIATAVSVTDRRR